MGPRTTKRILLAVLLAMVHLGALFACSESPAPADPNAATMDAATMNGTGPASAGADERHEAPPVRGEQLRAEAPDGWQQGFATETPALRIVEFIPPGSSRDDWQEKVTFESLSGHPLPDPIDFVTGIAADQAATCEPFEHFNIQSGLENNYPTSVRLLSCGHNPLTEKGQVTLIKAIAGNDHFYVVTRAKRVPPPAEGTPPISEAEMAIWAAYMRAISVCDSDRDAHPCTSRSDPPADP